MISLSRNQNVWLWIKQVDYPSKKNLKLGGVSKEIGSGSVIDLEY